jgi:hypothetical protein
MCARPAFVPHKSSNIGPAAYFLPARLGRQRLENLSLTSDRYSAAIDMSKDIEALLEAVRGITPRREPPVACGPSVK